MKDDLTLTKRRIEACAIQATLNATRTGGDEATASVDLLCAFVLITVMDGGDPDAALDVLLERSKTVVADFWPEQRMN